MECWFFASTISSLKCHYQRHVFDKLLANIKSPGSAKSEQRRQLELLAQMNQLHNQSGRDDSILESHISTMETAYRMQIEATDAFDISSETAKTKESYGSSKFAQSCLLARRLAERGVRFTTVYYTKDSSNQPWDTHENHYESHANLCADADKAAAALINDLKSRGLLEDTLVVFEVNLVELHTPKTMIKRNLAVIITTLLFQ